MDVATLFPPQLSLKRPLVCFDLETTGLANARVVSMAFFKIHPSSTGSSLPRVERFGSGNFRSGDASIYVRPPVTITAQASQVHGLTNRDLAHLPPFSAHAQALHEFLKGCDITGYNVAKFDLPILQNEFAACGIAWPPAEGNDVPCVVDTLKLFRDLKRNLELAHYFFTDQELVGAHNAEVDTVAALKVLFGMVRKNSGLREKIEDILRNAEPIVLKTIENSDATPSAPKKRSIHSSSSKGVTAKAMPSPLRARPHSVGW